MLKKSEKTSWNKKSQVTIFIIIAIIIVAGISAYFLLRGKIITISVPEKFKQVEDYFLQCIEGHVKIAAGMMGEQAGYIYLPEFEAGSAYMPTSSQLNFLGIPVPYWHYISGNNIVKEQIPTKQEIQKQIARYLEENLFCDFSYFRERGYQISLGEKKIEVAISGTTIRVNVKADLSSIYENESYTIKEHDLQVKSNLGKNYDLALGIYKKEGTEMFLENYGLDVLYLNAPVNNVELSCSPKVWVLENVRNDLKKALEANIIMLNTKAKYFNLNLGENVRFLYSKDWPTKIETSGKQGVLVAEPIGNQPGLGILGFCYVPYHFVYDLTYPVLVQIYDGNELFQFPVAAVIQGNKPREAEGNALQVESEICENKNSEIEVNTYNTNLESIDAEISFKCLNEVCDIGFSKDGKFIGNFPKCVNGFILAKAPGYELKKLQASTNVESSFNIILDRLYNVSLVLKSDGKKVGEFAIISFESQDTSRTIAWPEMTDVELTEGLYNVSVYIYKNGSISIPSSSEEKCIKTIKPGLLGIFGATEEKCFNLEIPSQIISNVLFGGGKSQQYVSETELQKGNMEIGAGLVEMPSSLEQLQNSFNAVEEKQVYLEFK